MNILPNVWHVYPQGEGHVLDGGPCWCAPERKREGDGVVVTHHSLFDMAVGAQIDMMQKRNALAGAETNDAASH